MSEGVDVNDHTVSPLPVALRRERMLELIGEREFVRVGDLSETFGISEVTVRSDLEALQANDVIRRVRGGAMLRYAMPVEPSFEEAIGANAAQKAAIAHKAASLVGSGTSVLLDVGTTTTLVARELAARTDLENVVVITNGLTIAMELEQTIPRFTVVVTGGTLRPQQHSLIDPMVTPALEQLHADVAFIGCNGVDVDGGITNLNLPEAEVKRRMVTSVDKAIVVADSSKIGQVHLGRVARLTDVDILITSCSAPATALSAFRAAGLNVCEVSP